MVKKVTKNEEVDEAPKKKVTAKKVEDAAPTKKAAKKEVAEDSNTVGLASLCADLGIDPRAARVKLRKSEFNKGDGRWEWEADSKELKAVTAFLTPVEKEEAEEKPVAKKKKAA